jgi:tripartite-type tricarboxylate transporter receptor subunit TctC
MKKTLVSLALGAIVSTTAFDAASQAFPAKPVRFITAGVGGGNDFTARLIAPELSAGIGQPVVVDNRASSTVAAEAVAKAPPDGYALLVAGGSFTIGPLLQQTPYDVLRDFAPVIQTGAAPNILTVHPSLPVKSVKDLISLAKARPGDINYSSATPGSSSHLSAELLKHLARINIMQINYKSSGQAVTAILGGEVQVMFPNMPSAAPHLKSGRLKALAVTSAKPSTLLAGVPTVAATVPGYEATSMDGLYAPAKTPAAVITRLNQEIARAVQKAEIKERFFNAGVEVVGGSPEQLDRAVKDELALWGKVIKEAGIRTN